MTTEEFEAAIAAAVSVYVDGIAMLEAENLALRDLIQRILRKVHDNRVHTMVAEALGDLRSSPVPSSAPEGQS